MTKRLPDQPNLDHLRREAKTLLSAHIEQRVDAISVLRRLPRLHDRSDAEILGTRVTLQQMQHALALEYGFRNWSELKREVAVGCRVPATGSERALRSRRIRDCLHALRQYSVMIHPDWTDGTPWGWGLALPASSTPAGLGATIALLEDPSWRVRREAISALAAYVSLGDDSVLSALRDTLADDRHAVQHAAARALGVHCPGCGTAPRLSEYVSI